MHVDDNVVLGLDIGIGSLGWALLWEDPDTFEKKLLSRSTPQGEVRYALGSRVFSIPEDAKTKELLNVQRRSARMQRRVVRRRAQRMRALRQLLAEAGVRAVLDSDAFHLPRGVRQRDPWVLRKAALERRLTEEEFATILIHMAKHRGFKSNSKKDRSGQDAESGRMLQGISELRQEVAAAQTTAGAWLADAPRKRNYKDFKGNGVYSRTLAREMLEEESDRIFATQARFGLPLATPDLCRRYKKLAFEQRPLKSVADMVGKCVFCEGERRAPAFAPTAERFRLAQRLVHLRLLTQDRQKVHLSRERLVAVLALAEQPKQEKITYKTVRTLWRLPKETQFDGLGYGRTMKGKAVDPESADMVCRSGAALRGSRALYACLGETAFHRLYALRLETGAGTGQRCLDYLARLFSENDDLDFIFAELRALPLEAVERSALETGLTEGTFAFFKGTLRLSLKAMEAILPPMLDCGEYAQGCELAGFDFRREQQVDIHDIRNPVVQHMLREVRRQTAAILHDWHVLPGRVHIELLREVGKSPADRNAMEKGIKERTAAKERARQHLAELFHIAPEQVSPTELRRYELWKEQDGKCAYYMLWRGQCPGSVYRGETAEGAIPVSWLRDGTNAVQIDHILPRSRTFDNSFHNMCLCCTSANQAKGGKTPFEWIGRDHPEAWHEYSAWVRSLPVKGFKKRNYLLENLDADIQGRFHTRNLTDSSYGARLVARWFREEYARLNVPMLRADGTEIRRVFARPGAVTNFLRIHWGVQGLKKDAQGKRLEDDRHHALDALLVACCTEGQLQRITRAYQEEESTPERIQIPLPWASFREDVREAYDQIFVSRALRVKKTGALHEETLRSIRREVQEDGSLREILYERWPIQKLKEKDLADIKDAERCPDVLAALRRWLALPEKDRLKEENLPRSAHGDIIRRVRIRRGAFTSGVRLQRGGGVAQADNGEMARTDVYTKDGKFYLVPVYLKQLADGIVPRRAIVAFKDEDQWLEMDARYQFCFSLEKDCYVITESKGGLVKEGYFLGTNRGTAAISLASMTGRGIQMKGIGVQRLSRFEKYRVDRLGRIQRVVREADPRKA